MTPPFRTPSNASYFFSGFHSATTSPFFGKLRICSPSGFAGPQPQHVFFGAYFSWRDLSLTVELISRPNRGFSGNALTSRRGDRSTLKFAEVDRLLRRRRQVR